MSDPEKSGPTTGFDYSGYLLFEPFQTKVQGRLDAGSVEVVEDEISRSLPTFERGSPESPGNGFEILDIEKTQDIALPDQELNLRDVISFKHSRESFELVEVYEQGEYKEASTVSIDSVDVYWKYPNFIYIRGSKENSKKTFSRLRNLFVDSLYIKRINFEPEFLLWLFYKHYQDESAGRIDIVRLQDAVLSGERDEFGSENKISESTDVLSSSTVLTGLLHGKDLIEIEGGFRHNTGIIVVNIKNDRVHIKSSSGAISQQSSVERISTAISFLTNLCNTYSNWAELPAKDRYPPPQFFREVYQDALENGIEVNSISSDVLQRYANLRGEDWNQTDE